MNVHVFQLGLIGLMIISLASANRRTCFCEIRTGSSKSSPLLTDVDNPYYSHWLHYTCRSAIKNCPGDCRAAAARALGGSTNPLDNNAGLSACQRLGRTILPEDRVHLYAHYKTSSCGHEGHTYLGEVCCWKLQFQGVPYPFYLFNQSCDIDGGPILVG